MGMIRIAVTTAMNVMPVMMMMISCTIPTLTVIMMTTWAVTSRTFCGRTRKATSRAGKWWPCIKPLDWFRSVVIRVDPISPGLPISRMPSHVYKLLGLFKAVFPSSCMLLLATCDIQIKSTKRKVPIDCLFTRKSIFDLQWVCQMYPLFCTRAWNQTQSTCTI